MSGASGSISNLSLNRRFRVCLCLIALPLIAGCGSKAGPVEEGGRGAVQPGIEVLLEGARATLGGKRVGLLTHAAGIDRNLRSSVDLLRENSAVALAALFSPEHGIRGSAAAGEQVSGGRDPISGILIHSLYGKTKKPTPEMLAGIDVLVIDLQDIGSRSYTYISTLYYALEAAAGSKKRVVVCDRPNPMGGMVVDGPVLEPSFRSFIGVAPIPVVHGMTIGELAMLFNAEFKLGCDLSVISMRGWNRGMVFRETGLYWVAPSPHIPTAETALYYPIKGLIGEMGTISEGVGTPMPFHLVGAPWMDGRKLAAELPTLHGVVFRPLTVKPFYFRNAGEEVHGVQIYVTDPMGYRPVETSIHLLSAVRRLWPEKLEWHPQGHIEQLKNVDSAWGTDRIRLMITAGRPAEEIIGSYEPELKKFRAMRKKYLIY